MKEEEATSCPRTNVAPDAVPQKPRSRLPLILLVSVLISITSAMTVVAILLRQNQAIPKLSCSRAKEIYPIEPLPGKKGACFTLRNPGQKGSWEENIPKVMALKPSWNYSWGPQRVEAQPDNIEFIPMIWRLGVGKHEKLNELINDHILPQIKAGYAKRLLVFNEPDKQNQANMAVSTATSYWPFLESLDISLVSPAPAKLKGEWMADFVGEVESECFRMEYVALHWYWEPNSTNFKQKMRSLHEVYGRRPILLTEFAIADWEATTIEENRFSQAKVLDFMKEVLPWLEAQDWIAGYAWFSFKESHPQGTSSALFTGDGEMTALGKFYASVTPATPNGDQTIEVDL